MTVPSDGFSFMVIVAPIISSPVFASLTLPLMSLGLAVSAVSRKRLIKNGFCISVYLYLIPVQKYPCLFTWFVR